MSAVFKIGYGAVGWMQPMTVVARRLAEMGVEGIGGFGLTELLPDDHRLGEVLRAAKIAFSGAYASGSFVEPDQFGYECEKFKRVVGKIAELGGSTVVVGGGRIFDEDRVDEQRGRDWPRFLDSIRQLAAFAKAAGVRFGYHPHRGTLVFHPREIERFVEDTKGDAGLIGLTLDSAHLAVGGSDVCDAFARYHSRTVHIHLKDVSKLDPKASGYREEDRFVTLGAGSLPLKELLQGIRDRGYQGWVTVELDASDEPAQDARMSLANLNRWLKELGVVTNLRV